MRNPTSAIAESDGVVPDEVLHVRDFLIRSVDLGNAPRCRDCIAGFNRTVEIWPV